MADCIKKIIQAPCGAFGILKTKVLTTKMNTFVFKTAPILYHIICARVKEKMQIIWFLLQFIF